MKRTIFIFLIAAFSAIAMHAQQPLREVRAFWFTTAWNLDWPGTIRVPAPIFAEDGVTITNETARENARQRQQALMLGILDRLEAANYNTIYFQVRPMADAFYNSSFEPWSKWLSTGINPVTGLNEANLRGVDPGWSPLGFLIEHAHARGMEVHAWLNPYRYTTAPGWVGTHRRDYDVSHPEWLLDYGVRTNADGTRVHPRILNPGIPEVRTRIADIIEDIITQYNVDGIVFDDYFYVSGTTNAMDQAQFDAYPNGFTAAQRADWRRANINLMIREVNDRINSIAPWIAFGVSPAGVSLGSNHASVAARYGILPTPIGQDWQFADISAHPVAWLSENTIDYISPQIYWRVNAAARPGTWDADFKRIAEWWAEVSNHFGRHFFSSVVSHVPGNDRDLFTTDEMMRQIRLLRNADRNNTSGVVGFRVGNFLSTTLEAFVEDPFRYQALTASFGWHYAPIQGLVQNLAVSGQNVTWNYTSTDSRTDVRYVVWAIPKAHRNDVNVFTNPRFLQGMTWTNSFTLAEDISPATHAIAVAVFDRFGNLFAPRVLGEPETIVAQANLTFPANNQSIPTFARGTQAQNLTRLPQPTLFSWEDNGADFWIWQVANDAAFTDPIASRETSAPSFNSAMQGNLRTGQTYYWRVLSVKANAVVSVSDVRVFNTTTENVSAPIRITAPTLATETAPLTPAITWTAMTGATFRVEISSRLDFGDIAYVRDGITATSISVPSGHLEHSTTYHVRVIATVGGNTFVSQPHFFATTFVPLPPMTIPVILTPTVGEAVSTAPTVEIVWEEQRSRGFEIQLSDAINFPPMGTNTATVSNMNYSVTISTVVRGTSGPAVGVRFLRMRANWEDGARSPWTEVIEFTVSAQTSVETPDALSFMQVLNTADGNVELIINQTENSAATISIFSVTGTLVYSQTHNLNGGLDRIPLDLTDQSRGVYLLQVNVGNRVETQRIVR